MEQLTIQTNEKITSCAFTGHRTLEKDFSKAKLKKEIIKAIEKGANVFYCGMAMGFDLAAAETVLSLKKKYPCIKLIACSPCPGQEKNFSEKDKKRYVKIWNKSDEKNVLSPHYYQGCMLVRNKYMVDRCDGLIAYCNKTVGGTAYTVKYFKKTKPFGYMAFVNEKRE